MPEYDHHVQDMIEAAQLFKAFSDANRLKIIGWIVSDGGDARCVNDLAGLVGISQPAVSQHLRILRSIGLLRGFKRGAYVYYRVDRARLKEIKAQFDLLFEMAGRTCLVAE